MESDDAFMYRASRRIHPSKIGGLPTNKANLELMRGSHRQLVQIYRYRRGGEIRTRGKEAGRGAFRFLARHSGASADKEVQMKTSEASWWDGREVSGLKDSYPTLLRIFRFVCFSHESCGEKKDDGWMPSSDFGSFFCMYYMQACHFFIYFFIKNITSDQNHLTSLW